MQSQIIEITSLTITLKDFETSIWNATGLDNILDQKYLISDIDSNQALQLHTYVAQFCDPAYKVNQWIMSKSQKDYDKAMFWLKTFLNTDMTVIWPTIQSDPEFINNVRKMSSPIYSKLIKNIQNF
jgi:hypothetical protein